MLFNYFLVFGVFLFEVNCDVFCSKRGTCLTQGDFSLSCHDFIPPTVPDGITRVTLECFEGTGRTIDINNTTFSGKGWDKVQMLEIKNPNGRLTNINIKFYSDSFMPMGQLKDLRVHMTGGNLYPGVFNGLNHLESLDLSNCTLFSENQLRRILTENVLMNLTTLTLSRVGLRTSGLTIDNTLNTFFGARPIKYLDVSYLHLTLLNFTGLSLNCDKMETIIAKGLLSTGLYQNYHRDNVCRNLKKVDLSELRTSHSYICAGPDLTIENDMDFKITLKGLQPFSRAEDFIASNYCLSPIFLKNITNFRFDTTVPWYIRRLNFDHNYLEYADIEILCDHSTIEYLSLRFNTMKYISPKFFTCMVTLTTLDLGHNQLSFMEDSDQNAFEELLKFLPNLEQFSLNHNGLRFIPSNMFIYTRNLTILDLSGNNLQQFYAKMDPLKEIKLLNISNNNINMLDSKSLNACSVLLAKKTEFEPWIDMRGNPLYCTICEGYLYLSWIISNRKVIHFPEQLLCQNDNGEVEGITESTIDHLKTICEQPGHTKNIAITTTVVVIIIGVFVLSFYVGRTVYIAFNKKLREAIILRKIQEGEDKFEFLVFLAYSNADEDFVKDMVLKNLRSGLETLTGAGRDLVCTGDMEFRPGHSIPEEVCYCLSRSCVVMFILSNSSLASGYCKTEFDTAVLLNMPVIFMLKEMIDKELLSPQMKLVFDKQARILWKQDGDDYILATTWGNVSKAVINILLDS